VGAAPDLSVVIGCPGRVGALHWTVSRLAVQTIADRIELVIVTSEPASLHELGHAADAFAHVELVVQPTVVSVAAANAAGARAARAPFVVFGEDHSFPERGWAAALVARHLEGWTAVAPVVRNANPSTIVSWCDFLTGYGPWMAPCEGGEREMLPGHNTSYERAVLLTMGDRLECALEVEAVMQAELPAGRAGRLFLEPQAVTHHVNFALRRSYFDAAYVNGRLFAAARREGWGTGRRLAYGLGSWLIPAVRLIRILRQLHRSGRRAEVPIARVVPGLLVGLAVDAAGQAVGYVRGADRVAAAARAGLEFDRWRNVPATDRERLAATYAPTPTGG
jgi:hypothetical protein